MLVIRSDTVQYSVAIVLQLTLWHPTKRHTISRCSTEILLRNCDGAWGGRSRNRSTLRRCNFGSEELLTSTTVLNNRIVLSAFAFLLSGYKIVLSARLYAYKNSSIAEWIFMKPEIWRVSRDDAEQFELSLLLDENMDALREDTWVFLRKSCTTVHICPILRVQGGSPGCVQTALEKNISSFKLQSWGSSSPLFFKYKLGFQLTVRTQPLYIVLIYLSE